jgi:hypothetical protein
LTTGQVVAIAGNGGGKQALEAVKEHLQELRADPYGLTTGQVVAIASNDGGKQALKAVKELLPKLLEDPYGLTTEQAVDAVCLGGRPALKAIEEYMPDLRERFDTERLLTIVALGGDKALQALKRGLPWAATRQLGRRTTVEKPSPSAAVLMPGAKELTAVLKFFNTHDDPPRAFPQARDEFRMSRQALLRLLTRAGVTELEAIGGTIPDASERWRRLLLRLDARFASSSDTTSSPQPMQGFAESLERSLMSPGPIPETSTVQAAKRPAETATASLAKRPRLDVATQAQDVGAPGGQSRAGTLHPAALAATPLRMGLQWGIRAPSTQRGHRLEQQPEVAPANVASPRPEGMEDFGLMDPGSPTAGDLAFPAAEFRPGHVGPSDPANTLALIDEDFDWLDRLLRGL